MQNHPEIAEFRWKIADLTKDDYDAKAYEDVILPFTLLRRLDVCWIHTAGPFRRPPINTRRRQSRLARLC